jgi:hypothetical protein
VDVDGAGDDGVAEIVGLAVADAALDATAHRTIDALLMGAE